MTHEAERLFSQIVFMIGKNSIQKLILNDEKYLKFVELCDKYRLESIKLGYKENFQHGHRGIEGAEPGTNRGPNREIVGDL